MSVAPPVPSAGGIDTYNIDHGFAEAVVRGFRSSFLLSDDYDNLTQCETLEDMKMNLAETDYDQFLAHEQVITPAKFTAACLKKLVDEFKFLQYSSYGELTTFLEYITYEYMIDNVMLLLKGTLSGRPAAELIKQCHPLGMFKESTMRLIPTFEPTAKGCADLYQTVLIDTPVGPYFSEYLTQSSERIGSADEVRNILEEVQIEIIRSSLMKIYLEDFYRVVLDIGGETANFMGHLLKQRADKMAISITVNSIGTSLNDVNMRRTRASLFPSFGYLYPAVTNRLLNVSDEGAIDRALEINPEYSKFWQRVVNSGEKTLDDIFFERDTYELEYGFEGQMHMAVFYAYVKLKEHEIRNITWIAECILQNKREEIYNFIPIFSQNSTMRQMIRGTK